MTVKFVASWKIANGDPDEEGIDEATKEARKITDTVREFGAVFDPFMPLMLAGGGAAIGPAALAIAQFIPTEDESGIPLYVGRDPATNKFIIVAASISIAATTLFVSLLAGIPPTKETGTAAWALTPAGIAELALAAMPPSFPSPKLLLAMGQYLGSVISGGDGTDEDPPPPPGLTDPPDPPAVDKAKFFSLIAFGDGDQQHSVILHANLINAYTKVFSEPGMLRSEVTTQDFPVTEGEQMPYIFAWSATDPLNGDADVTAFFKPDNLQSSPVFLADRTGLFTVKLTVCNAAGSLSDTRTDVNITN